MIFPCRSHLSLSARAFLHCTSRKSGTRSKGLKRSSKNITDPKGNQLLQSKERTKPNKQKIAYRYLSLDQPTTSNSSTVNAASLPGFHLWCNHALQNRLLPQRKQQQTRLWPWEMLPPLFPGKCVGLGPLVPRTCRWMSV